MAPVQPIMSILIGFGSTDRSNRIGPLEKELVLVIGSHNGYGAKKTLLLATSLLSASIGSCARSPCRLLFIA